MAHFAKLNEDNIVIGVNVVSNDVLDPQNEEQSGIEFLTQWSGGYANWKQTSYNAAFRKRYAGVGFYYDANLDAFIEPKPFPSWSLNPDTCDWEAPKPYPQTENKEIYFWDEELGDWVNAETL